MGRGLMPFSIVKKPPSVITSGGIPSVFLAGSIEMGLAENWQEKVERELAKCEVTIYNPRRDDWDSSWEQKMSNHQFCTQVSWELKAMDTADRILMYFDPSTKAPISLLELGLHARGNKLIVVCPNGFWRKGNVDIVCAKYKVTQVQTLDEAISILKSDLSI
jgi:hypothetical protein